MKAFNEAYSSLNPAQKQAVDTIDGPVMVIAGPGTGKTQILATRIANILKQTDTDAAAILALTFTDSGSTAMRSRLLELIGSDAYKVHISTFHSFTSSIIQEFPDHFIYAEQAQPLTDLERFQILHNIIDTNDFDLLKPLNAPHYYLSTQSAIPSAIQSLKREGVTPEDLRKILDEELKNLDIDKDSITKTEFEKRNKDLVKNIDLLKIYHQYQEGLKNKGRYDFDDMIIWVLDEFKKHDSELLSILQERFHFFLVDEYQDTNSAQNQIVDSLASYWGDRANLFVVGDDEQSIYRFQGASLENALNFKKTYPTAKIINLKNNYRSQQNILDASRSVIENNKNNLQTTFPDISRKLVTKTDHPLRKVAILEFQANLLEHYAIAKDIQKLINQKTTPSQIAIIAHTNGELSKLSSILSHLELPHRFQGEQNVLEHLVVKYFLKILTVIHQSRTAIDDLNLFTLLHYPFMQIDPLDIQKLTRAAANNKNSLIDYIHSDDFKTLKLSNSDSFTLLLTKMAHWNQLDSTTTFTEFCEVILNESGLLSWMLALPDSSVHLRSINYFFDYVKQANNADHNLNLDTFQAILDLMDKNNLHVSAPELELNSNKVVLTTAHKAKGLEWEHVFIIGCTDGNWGNKNGRSLINLPSHVLRSDLDHDPLEEERRLFYVALTRAKRTLSISYSTSTVAYNRVRETLPSQFIGEITPSLIDKSKPTIDPKEIDIALQKIINPATKTNLTPAEAIFVDSVLKDFRLSVTALNTYLECPYKFKLNNLLRVPKAKQPHLAFGTAVHSALEKFYQYYQQEQRFPDQESFVNFFETALKKEVLSDHDHQARLDQGRKILAAYYQTYQDDFRPALETEKYFGYSFNPVYLDDVPLVGKVDRIDWVDQSDRTVKVADYKTGKRKTRGQIEGSTQDSNGSYKRQLVFYKLLADLDSRFPATVVSAELDFVETPHNEGKSGKESFSITQEEIEDLKEVIKKTMKEIRSHNFDRTTDYSVCQMCDFKDHCWPVGIPTDSPTQLRLINSSDESTIKASYENPSET